MRLNKQYQVYVKTMLAWGKARELHPDDQRVMQDFFRLVMSQKEQMSQELLSRAGRYFFNRMIKDLQQFARHKNIALPPLTWMRDDETYHATVRMLVRLKLLPCPEELMAELDL